MKKCDLYSIAFTVVIGFILLFSVPAEAIVTQQWASRLAGPNHGLGSVCGVGTDSDGNVYVAGVFWAPHTGDDYIVIKYDPGGAILWRSLYQTEATDWPTAMTVDAAGNVYVTGTTGSTMYATVKINSEGQQQWVARYNSTGYGEGGSAIALDSAGNVYVTGGSFGSGTGSDYATIKYNSQGIEQWVARYNGPGNEDDGAIDLALDQAGNVYVTGMSSATSWPNTEYDYATVKYDSQGIEQWVATYNGTGNDHDEPCGLVLDAQSNVYVSGTSEGSGNNKDYATIKYNSQGIEQWVARYDSPRHGSEFAKDLKLDSDGNVIVCGEHFCLGYLTVKYDTNGSILWVKRYEAISGYLLNQAWSLAVDVEQNIYVTGGIYTSLTSLVDCTTIKYDPQGNLQWAVAHNENNCAEQGKYVTLDDEGNVIVAGIFKFPDQSDYDFLTIKYNQIDGNVIVGMVPLVTPVQIPASGGSFSYHLMAINNVVDSLAVDFWWRMFEYPNDYNMGPVHVVLPLDSTATIRTQNVPARVPAETYRYIVYAGEYPCIIWASDTLYVVKLAAESSPIISDWSQSGEPLAGITQKRIPSPDSPLLVFPNPFNPTTVISYTLQEAVKIHLSVYDVTGRQVVELVNGWRDAGVHEMTFDGSDLASGIYIYRLQMSGSGATPAIMRGKMVLLK